MGRGDWPLFQTAFGLVVRVFRTVLRNTGLAGRIDDGSGAVRPGRRWRRRVARSGAGGRRDPLKGELHFLLLAFDDERLVLEAARLDHDGALLALGHLEVVGTVEQLGSVLVDLERHAVARKHRHVYDL